MTSTVPWAFSLFTLKNLPLLWVKKNVSPDMNGGNGEHVPGAGGQVHGVGHAAVVHQGQEGVEAPPLPTSPTLLAFQSRETY